MKKGAIVSVASGRYCRVSDKKTRRQFDNKLTLR